MHAQSSHCGELSWKKGSDDYTHQWIAKRQVGPVSVYSNGLGVMFCVCGMAFLCGSTFFKVPLLQAGTVVRWSQMFKSDVKETNTLSGWPVAIKDDWVMLGRALANVEPQPTGEKMLSKLQWAQISQQAIQTLSDRWGEGYANAHTNAMIIHTIDLIPVIFKWPQPVWIDLWIWYGHGAEPFLCDFVTQYSKLYWTHVFRFIFLIVY